MNVEDIVAEIEALGSERNREGMARFGINVDRAAGVSVSALRELARKLPKSHELALELWQRGMHETRILASMVEEPERVTDAQLEDWVIDLNSWDLCDQCCQNLFWRTQFSVLKAEEWAMRQEEFVRRAGLVLMAIIAKKDKEVPDYLFLSFLPLIKRAATDERNFVKKAASWALRNIGKRNAFLNEQARAAAEAIRELDTPAARWLAGDVLKEITDEKVLAKLG